MAEQLPPGWEKKWNPQYSRWYYINHRDKSTSWTAPKPVAPKPAGDDLPEGWQKLWNQQYNRHYYVNHNTKSTQWTKPEAETASVAQSSTAQATPRRMTPQESVADSDTYERPVSDSEFMQSLSTYFNNIRSDFAKPMNFNDFYQSASTAKPALAALREKARAGNLDRNLDLAVAHSMLDDHKSTLNYRYKSQQCKGDKKDLQDVLDSFADVAAAVQLQSVAVEKFNQQWGQLNANEPLTSQQMHQCKNKVKEYCREYANNKAEAKRKDEQIWLEQKTELAELHKSLNIKMSLEDLGQSKFGNMWRRLQTYKVTYTDMNRMKNAIKEQAKHEVEAREMERIRKEQERQNSALTAQRRQQDQVRRMQQLEQLTKFASLFPPEYDFESNFSRWMLQLKNGPLSEEDFKACLSDIKVKMTRANEEALKAAQAKKVKKEPRAPSPRPKAKKAPKSNTSTPKTKARNPELRAKAKAEPVKRAERKEKPHENYGNVVRCKAQGSQGGSVARLSAKGPSQAKGPAKEWDSRVERVVPVGRTDAKIEKLVPEGAKLAGQFEKLTAKGPLYVARGCRDGNVQTHLQTSVQTSM